MIRNLAQKSYDEKVLKLAEKRISQIQKITKDYEDNEIENIYLKEHPERRKLIKPIEPIWEVRLAEWLAKEYKGKDLEEGKGYVQNQNKSLQIISTEME